MATVSLSGVTKVYAGGVTAVRGFDLEVGDGEFVVLVGPSGCGKSTTLRMIAGLEEISGGEIRIDGRVVNDIEPKDRDIAMVFQNYALYPHMTVYDNMAFGLKLRKMGRAEIRERVEEAARLLGIEELLERKPKALSGGQRQRVAVGRAIVRHPKVFLFDEPLSNLDAKMRVQMRVEINRLHGRLGATMVYVTHDQVEAMTMGDRIVVMRDGAIEQVAQPLELYRNPATMFVGGFIGSPPMNLLHGKLEGALAGAVFAFDGQRVKVPADQAARLHAWEGREIVLGLRPEDIEMVAEGGVGPSGQTVAAHVDVVEPMGAEMIVDLLAGGQSCVARVAPDEGIRSGQERQLVFRMQKGHFFDPKTEQALT